MSLANMETSPRATGVSIAYIALLYRPLPPCKPLCACHSHHARCVRRRGILQVSKQHAQCVKTVRVQHVGYPNAYRTIGSPMHKKCQFHARLNASDVLLLPKRPDILTVHRKLGETVSISGKTSPCMELESKNPVLPFCAQNPQRGFPTMQILVPTRSAPCRPSLTFTYLCSQYITSAKHQRT
jgi:hypothetical protein